ncbi:DUF6114 domain-containing protein [Streptomyces sp. NPDC014733]|uniref:DUF6114 domain-containing protein n=1 Tax=Streptomyces sp. NPDC014733 TaxID=3364885 RepID=UPI0036FFDB41
MGAAGAPNRWRRWRRSRPFWGGLAAVLAGAEICALPLAPLKVMLQQGIAGVPSVLMGLVMILMGLSAWFTPQHRTLAGVLTVLGAMAALVMSNLGGFLIGTLLGILGGAMIFAWRPVTREVPPEADGTRAEASGVAEVAEVSDASGASGPPGAPGAAAASRLP